MWPIILTALRSYAPYVMLPITMTAGYIGYNLENWMHKNVEKKVSISAVDRERESLV